MASHTPKECGICNIEYNEQNRCPRSLPCSHCICSECIQNLINRNKNICPFCRHNFVANSAQDIGVNTGLLDVLKLLKEMEEKEAETSQPSESSHSSADDLTEFKREYIDTLQEMLTAFKEVETESNTAVFNNQALRDSCLLDIQSLQRDLLIRVEGMMITTDQRIRHINGQNERLESEVKSLQALQLPLEVAMMKLHTANSFEDASSLTAEAVGVAAEARKQFKSFKTSLSENRRIHEANKLVACGMKEKMRKLHETLNLPVEDEEDLEFLQDLQLKRLQRVGPEQITADTLQEKSEQIVRLVRQGRVTAVHQFQGIRRYAKLSITTENQFCLHHLNEQSLPANAHIILHSDVMKLVNPSSRLTFLELSNGNGQKLGRLYIRLHTDGDRASQFTLLCTGTVGPTYTSSKILELWEKGKADESLRFGNYENNGTSGGKALIPKVWKENREEYSRPQLAGSVQGRNSWFGESQAAQFWIYTRNNPEEKIRSCFGIVEEGLSVLTDAIHNQRKIKEVTISDSGIVLPL